jgi:hypothetical protein
MKWGKGVELDTQIDVSNLYAQWLTVAAATAHPNWEMDETRTTFHFLGGGGPRTPRGLERWFLRTYPEMAEQLWQEINKAVREARRGKHLRVVR